MFAAPVVLLFGLVNLTLGKKFLPKEAPPTQSMRQKAKFWSKKVGVRLKTVLANNQTSVAPTDAVSRRGRGLSIRSDTWEELSEPERDFAMARGVVQVKCAPPGWPYQIATNVLSVLACAAASVHLWTIPISWMVMLVFSFVSMGFTAHFARKNQYRSNYRSKGFHGFFQDDAKTYDRMALDMTGDLGAALSYLSKMGGRQRSPNEHQDRIDSLRTGANSDS